jgi:hypothetical protein
MMMMMMMMMMMVVVVMMMMHVLPQPSSHISPWDESVGTPKTDAMHIAKFAQPHHNEYSRRPNAAAGTS